ncbi:MAG: hypothetical protein ABFS09_09530 [Thermodesulfobacteriota bacterium]
MREDKDNGQVACGLCGQLANLSELMIDEEEGMALCPGCVQELESCGCTDEKE